MGVRKKVSGKEIKEIDEVPIIDWDYTLYDYEDLVEGITEKGWFRNPLRYSITDLDTNIVNINPTKKDSNDIFMEITCPEENLITICGLDQGYIEDMLKSPNLYTIPHFFSIRLADENNYVISPTTIISISKINAKGEIEKLYQEFYGDLSSDIDGKLKEKRDRYFFMETIILQSKEKLVFRAYRSNKDISKVNLFMRCDSFYWDKNKKEDKG